MLRDVSLLESMTESQKLVIQLYHTQFLRFCCAFEEGEIEITETATNMNGVAFQGSPIGIQNLFTPFPLVPAGLEVQKYNELYFHRLLCGPH